LRYKVDDETRSVEFLTVQILEDIPDVIDFE